MIINANIKSGLVFIGFPINLNWLISIIMMRSINVSKKSTSKAICKNIDHHPWSLRHLYGILLTLVVSRLFTTVFIIYFFTLRKNWIVCNRKKNSLIGTIPKQVLIQPQARIASNWKDINARIYDKLNCRNSYYKRRKLLHLNKKEYISFLFLLIIPSCSIRKQ